MHKIIVLILVLALTACSTAYGEEEPTFGCNVDKFLGKVADGVSKTDAITGLRTIDSPFHNVKDW